MLVSVVLLPLRCPIMVGNKRYCVILPLYKFVMFFWANHIYGNVMLYMSLGLAVLLLL
jgi:hypothetical protein